LILLILTFADNRFDFRDYLPLTTAFLRVLVVFSALLDGVAELFGRLLVSITFWA